MNSTGWLQEMQDKSGKLIEACEDSYHLYLKWYTFTYGKQPADIATATGLTSATSTAFTITAPPPPPRRHSTPAE